MANIELLGIRMIETGRSKSYPRGEGLEGEVEII